MGNNLEQWRGAIGGFHGRICSGEWTRKCTTRNSTKKLNKTGKEAQKTAIKVIRKEIKDGLTCIMKGVMHVTESFLLVMVLSIIMMMTHHAPDMVRAVFDVPQEYALMATSTQQSLVTNSDIKEAKDIISLATSTRINQMGLLICGDIEVNPGPTILTSLVCGIGTFINGSPARKPKKMEKIMERRRRRQENRKTVCDGERENDSEIETVRK